jgi:hypothetical protein
MPAEAADPRHEGRHLDPMAYLFTLVLLGAGPLDRTWNFDSGPIDKPPSNFYFDTTNDRPEGRWQVIADGAQRVLAQLDNHRDRRRMALSIVRDVEVKDVRLTCRIKVVAGEAEQSAGIVWRYRNSENYLAARLDPVEKNIRLYRVVDGNRVGFGGADRRKLESNRWYTLRIEHRGRLVKVYLDDEMLFDERDRHFTRAGKIGLWTKGDSIVYFDDLHVRELDDD